MTGVTFRNTFSTVLSALTPCLLLIGMLFPNMLFAEESPQHAERVTMTVSPPLFQLGLARGVVWSSTVILHNGGETELVIRSTVENFSADGQIGATVFAPSGTRDEPTSHELATWVTLSDKDFFVPSGGEVRIPFTITIPMNAEPGGHYAALLIGPSPQSGGGNVSFSSLVSSLLYVKISGNIIEQGEITGLFPKHGLVQKQEAGFDLRFTNTGNVHVNPEGEIIIFNMFGRERGRIVVDQEHRFGTVLPGASRIFSFEWKGGSNFFDIGRYKAVAVLTYGNDKTKTAYKDVHFWVVPWVPLLIIFTTLTFFFWFTRRALRRYIAEAIQLEHARIEGEQRVDGKKHSSAQAIPALTLRVLNGPLAKGGAELRSLRGHSARRFSYFRFIKRYSVFIGSVLVLLVCVFLIGWYFVSVFKAEREYQMVIKKNGAMDIVIP